MQNRGRDPAIRVRGDATGFLKCVPKHLIGKDMSDPSIATVPLSVAELLILPGVSPLEDLAAKKIMGHVGEPKVLTLVWAMKEKMVTQEERAPSDLEEAFERQVALAAQYTKEPGLALTAAAVAKAHGHGSSEIEKLTDAEDADLVWVKELSYGNLLLDGDKFFAQGLRLLYILRARNLLGDRSVDSELAEVAKLIGGGFADAGSGHKRLSVRFKLPRIVKWLLQPMVPQLFTGLARYQNVQTTIEHVLLLTEYPRMTARERNVALGTVLDAVQSEYEHVGAFVNGARPAEAVEALVAVSKRRIGDHFDEALTPAVLGALNTELESFAAVFKEKNATTLSERLVLTMTAGARESAGSRSTVVSAGSNSTAVGGDEMSGTDTLVKSRVFLTAVAKLQKALLEGDSKPALILAACNAGCVTVMKHMLGKVDQSKLDPALTAAASYRLCAFKVEYMKPVAEAVADVVLPKVKDGKGDKVEDPRLVNYECSHDFVMEACQGNWGNCDFVNEFYHKVQFLKRGTAIPSRQKARWYIEAGESKLSDMLQALKGPMVAFFTDFLPYPKKMENGIEAILKGALEAAEQADTDRLLRIDILNNLNSFVLEALEDAGADWRTAWHSKDAAMPIPKSFVPKASKCKTKLDRSMEKSRAMVVDAQSNPAFTEMLTGLMQQAKQGQCRGQG